MISTFTLAARLTLFLISQNTPTLTQGTHAHTDAVTVINECNMTAFKNKKDTHTCWLFLRGWNTTLKGVKWSKCGGWWHYTMWQRLSNKHTHAHTQIQGHTQSTAPAVVILRKNKIIWRSLSRDSLFLLPVLCTSFSVTTFNYTEAPLWKPSTQSPCKAELHYRCINLSLSLVSGRTRGQTTSCVEISRTRMKPLRGTASFSTLSQHTAPHTADTKTRQQSLAKTKADHGRSVKQVHVPSLSGCLNWSELFDESRLMSLVCKWVCS